MFQYFQLLHSKLLISPISISGPMDLSTSQFSICLHIFPIYTSVCFQEFPPISDLGPMDLSTSQFSICFHIFPIYTSVCFQEFPPISDLVFLRDFSTWTLRAFTWWISLVLPGFYASSHLFTSIVYFCIKWILKPLVFNTYLHSAYGVATFVCQF